MSDTVIQVENLGKKYIIGHQQQERYTALRDVMANGAKSLGQRLLKPWGKQIANPAYEEFWALKDVSFEVKQGDRIGIIGRNGAGKSTLLKILSRITEPTTGKIRIKGRVASLLEVGTGFHAELTGRENIYLNGAILGMSKAEIKRKFDEIVDFAEVEKFLDTPVKRYSSGMYVRLAFAVAAHLEPEILIVDEVLAVGDAQFQKKCLGKMEDVGQEGRTVLFVSHNMVALKALCLKGIFLEGGKIKEIGLAKEVVAYYQKTIKAKMELQNHGNLFKFSQKHKIGIANIKYYLNPNYLENGWDIKIEFDVIPKRYYQKVGVGLSISSLSGISATIMPPYFTNYVIDELEETTKCIFECSNIQKYLGGGDYTITLWLSKPKVEYLLKLEDILVVTIPACELFGTGKYFEYHLYGLVPLPLTYRTEELKA